MTSRFVHWRVESIRTLHVVNATIRRAQSALISYFHFTRWVHINYVLLSSSWSSVLVVVSSGRVCVSARFIVVCTEQWGGYSGCAGVSELTCRRTDADWWQWWLVRRRMWTWIRCELSSSYPRRRSTRQRPLAADQRDSVSSAVMYASSIYHVPCTPSYHVTTDHTLDSNLATGQSYDTTSLRPRLLQAIKGIVFFRAILI